MFNTDIDAGVTREEVRAALHIVAAVGEAIRDLGSVPSGELYAQLMGKLDIGQYQAVIRTLKRTGLIRESEFLLTWTGPKREVECSCKMKPVQECPLHGIAASNARQNEHWQRVRGHD